MSDQPETDRIAIEDLTDELAATYTAQGYTLAFTEDVMRRDVRDTRDLPEATLPGGVSLAAWKPGTAPSFFAAYAAAFADRPGFPGWSQERWVEWTSDDPDFRPDLSWVALAPPGPVGFITCCLDARGETPLGFIIQTGTRPDWRGRGLAGALVARALWGFREDGRTAVLLDVNTNNPGARRLYERLGFVAIRRRGVFTRGG
ncbi:MAG TPA: GNAT family N-acetyltransferase [Ktedonobacterales bacterium]